MTYRNDYQLAEKMKNRFSGRGASVSGMRASSTSELMKRAQMGGDPSVNCSELDFRNGNISVNRRANPNPPTNVRPPYMNDPGRARSSNANGTPRPVRPTGGGTSSRPRTNPNGTGAGAPEGTGTSARPKPRSAQPVRKSNAPAKKKTKTKHTGKKTASGKEHPGLAFLKKLRAQPAGVTEEITEVRADGRRLTPMFAVFVAVGMLMIMSIVMSFSESYQTTTDIALLESTLAELKDTAAELELRLEEKNDIRVIERIATEELGMVKEDAVQRKYLSLSDGERIDLIENGSSATETPGLGLLLSSLWSSLGNLFDYFR